MTAFILERFVPELDFRREQLCRLLNPDDTRRTLFVLHLTNKMACLGMSYYKSSSQQAPRHPNLPSADSSPLTTALICPVSSQFQHV